MKMVPFALSKTRLALQRSLALPLIGIFLLLVTVTTAMLVWLTYAQDELQRKQEERLAHAGITARTDFILRNLGDYAIRNDAAANLVVTFNKDWANSHIGPYLMAVQGYEHTFVIGPQGNTIYGSSGLEPISGSAQEHLGPVVSAMEKKLRLKLPGTDQRSVMLAMVDGFPTMIGMAAIIPSDAEVQLPEGQPASYLVIAKRIDDTVAAMLERSYGLEDALIIGPSDKGAIVKDWSGKPIASVHWTSAKPGSKLRFFIIPFALVFIGLSAGGALLMLRQIAQALTQAQSAKASALAQEIKAEADREHTAQLQAAVEAVRLENSQLNQMADESRAAASIAKSQALAKVGDDLNSDVLVVLDSLLDTSAALDRQAAELRGSAEVTLASAGGVKSVSGDTRESLRQVVRATEILDGSCRVVREHTDIANRSLTVAIDTANNAVSRIDEAGRAVEEIDVMTRRIAALASQTNLLALNAAIEAARAGHQGSGFAVVASEVKGLASHTASLTLEVERKIDAIRQTTAGSIQAIHHLTETLAPVAVASDEIDRAINSQAQALTDVSVRVCKMQHVADSLGNIAEQARLTAEQDFANADSVALASRAVAKQIDTLRNRVSTFTSALRGNLRA